MNTQKAKDRLHELNLKSLDFARFEIATERVDYPLTDSVENARYEIYCLLWFNFISALFESDEIEDPNDIFGVGEVIRQHEKWWRNDPENENYNDDFRDFIERELSKQNTDERNG